MLKDGGSPLGVGNGSEEKASSVRSFQEAMPQDVERMSTKITRKVQKDLVNLG